MAAGAPRPGAVRVTRKTRNRAWASGDTEPRPQCPAARLLEVDFVLNEASCCHCPLGPAQPRPPNGQWPHRAWTARAFTVKAVRGGLFRGGGAFRSQSQERCSQAPAAPRCSVGTRGEGCGRPSWDAGLGRNGEAHRRRLPALAPLGRLWMHLAPGDNWLLLKVAGGQTGSSSSSPGSVLSLHVPLRRVRPDPGPRPDTRPRRGSHPLRALPSSQMPFPPRRCRSLRLPPPSPRSHLGARVRSLFPWTPSFGMAYPSSRLPEYVGNIYLRAACVTAF